MHHVRSGVPDEKEECIGGQYSWSCAARRDPGTAGGSLLAQPLSAPYPASCSRMKPPAEGAPTKCSILFPSGIFQTRGLYLVKLMVWEIWKVCIYLCLYCLSFRTTTPKIQPFPYSAILIMLQVCILVIITK